MPGKPAGMMWEEGDGAERIPALLRVPKPLELSSSLGRGSTQPAEVAP